MTTFLVSFSFRFYLFWSVFVSGRYASLPINKRFCRLHTFQTLRLISRTLFFSKEIYNIYILHVIRLFVYIQAIYNIYAIAIAYKCTMLLIHYCREVFLCGYQYYVIHTTMQYYILLYTIYLNTHFIPITV